MTEFEKKLLLTKEEYDYLLEYFRHDDPPVNKSLVKQVNYYYDTDALTLNRQNITCRIRLKNGKYEGTMKQRINGTEHSTETKMKVRNGIYENDFIDMGLKLQGELVTERYIILKNAICEVVLDKNDYLGHVDYELEIEYVPNKEKEAQSILQALLDMMRRRCVPAYKERYTQTQHVPSKSNRFFERKSKHELNS